ncbi:tRNA threonylcarbamoyladenosine biosynthesis protein TsaE [Caldalkalibacillus uzonensis]|uniref:tRNA threonylcarbamoyladenosine biosynthesis protein TsaE n=1 Tax=Caldalkalibacillus uzonensis TaxID=353224 RepID=A0ABU0CVN5_9BACI|nr:tRNA (adenosine(37)-N6)-threonylcarbamoyltransferase complex ATPase subunit type 1 TsaE [Caldalkalibacillus uzonensis]MDQ0340445.1 tRNA threonylcarbamoyladenosine biosynthesis protein TsaE [Caldalkalibacillus uzonensis]
MQTYEHVVYSHSVGHTQALAEALADKLTGGEVITLSGDLGAGKTSFVQGLARGLGITRKVNSPTFTIIKEYQGSQFPLYHIDAYRLEDETEDVGFEEYIYGDGVTVIEWPERIAPYLPEARLHIRIEKRGETERNIYLLPHGERFVKLVKEVLA